MKKALIGVVLMAGAVSTTQANTDIEKTVGIHYKQIDGIISTVSPKGITYKPTNNGKILDNNTTTLICKSVFEEKYGKIHPINTTIREIKGTIFGIGCIDARSYYKKITGKNGEVNIGIKEYRDLDKDSTIHNTNERILQLARGEHYILDYTNVKFGK